VLKSAINGDHQSKPRLQSLIHVTIYFTCCRNNAHAAMNRFPQPRFFLKRLQHVIIMLASTALRELQPSCMLWAIHIIAPSETRTYLSRQRAQYLCAEISSSPAATSGHCCMQLLTCVSQPCALGTSKNDCSFLPLRLRSSGNLRDKADCWSSLIAS
jgi:hypothetical protein